MAAAAVLVDWRGLFRSLTPARQRALEGALVEMGLVLGEYTELVERAFLEAYASTRSKLLADEADLQAAALRSAATLLASYSRRKRMFLLLSGRENLAWTSVAGALPGEMRTRDFSTHTPSSVRASSIWQRQQLRRRIHHRLEEIKRGD